MKMALEKGDGRVYLIRRYDSGRVTVNDETVTSSVLLTPETLQDWPPARFEELERAHLDPVLELEPEVVLLGTGESQRFPSREFMLALLQRGIGIEVMDTASACRTYNILMGEGRRVAAALIVG